MRIASVLFSVLLLSSTPLLAKDGKKHKAAAKECEEKGGQWDKKKKTCKLDEKKEAAPAATPAPAPTEGDMPPAENAGEAPK